MLFSMFLQQNIFMSTTPHNLLLLIIQSGAEIHPPKMIYNYLSIPVSSNIDCIYFPRVFTLINWKENLTIFSFPKGRGRLYNKPFFGIQERYRMERSTIHRGFGGLLNWGIVFRLNFLSLRLPLTDLDINSLMIYLCHVKVNYCALSSLCSLKPRNPKTFEL